MNTFLSPDFVFPTPSFNIEVFLLFGGGSFGECVASGEARCWTSLCNIAALSPMGPFIVEDSPSVFEFCLNAGMLGRPPFRRFVIALRAIRACRLGKIGLSDGCLSLLLASSIWDDLDSGKLGAVGVWPTGGVGEVFNVGDETGGIGEFRATKDWIVIIWIRVLLKKTLQIYSLFGWFSGSIFWQHMPSFAQPLTSTSKN